MSADSTDFEPSDQFANDGATIFVSDPSAEADRLSTALRGRGYSVIDVPLSLLLARVAVQTPSLILLDIDAEGALDVATRLREIPGALGIDVLFLGDPGRTLAGPEDALRQEGSGFLARPVNVQDLLRKVGALIGARYSEDAVEPAEPAEARSTNVLLDRASPNSVRVRRTPIPQPWPDRPTAINGPDDMLEPAFGSGEPSAPRLPLPALSPEIERLLQGAEDRAGHDVPPSSPTPERPTPDEEVDAVLPAEVLAALDEPLDENDDDLESDSGLSTGAPRKGGTVAPGALTSSGSPMMMGDLGTGSKASRSPLTGVREPPAPDPRFVSPSAYAAAADADPKEKETPRPPKRGGSAAPSLPVSVPAPARESRLSPPARESRGAPPPARESRGAPPSVRESRGAPRDPRFSSSPPPSPRTSSPNSVTLPPAAGSRRRSTPPLPPVFSSPPLASEGALADPRLRATVPPSSPGGDSLPSTHPPQALSGEPSVPTPRGLLPSALPARRTESDIPPEGGTDALPAFALPEVLGPGDALAAFAVCVRERAVGALCIEVAEGVRRILLRDGDVVTAASGLDEESLVAFLGTRGDIGRDVVKQLHGKIPAFGRHAGAALVANGHITQDQLWPVLRAHAEWILRCAISAEKGTASFEVSPPGRLKAEPSVFGGATGAEVLIEVVRRAVPAQSALLRLGGGGVRLVDGPRRELLPECALAEVELRWINRAKGSTLDEVLASGEHLDLGPMIYALVQLGVLAVGAKESRSRSRSSRPAKFDPIDIESLRNQIKTRMSLVEEGDYFSLLGVPRTATAYDIHRAYVEIRRGLEPSRVLSAATADLADDLRLIIDVLDEAHDILRDHGRRERYRRAIEDKPPV